MEEKFTQIEEIISPEENLPEIEELEKIISEKRFSDLKQIAESIPPADVAELLGNMDVRHCATAYRLLPKELAAEVFVEMDTEVKEHLINSFTDRELSLMLDELYIDDTVDIIEEMPAVVVKRIIKNSQKENRDIINKLLKYPKDCAGAIMTTEYVRFKKDMTVDEALSHVRKVAIDKETIYTCYVTDEKRRLIGIVTAKELLISPLDKTLGDIMEESVIFARTTDDKEEVALKFDRYGFLALPVVDAECRLVGIITVDDAISVIKEEAEEDFAKMAAITPSETTYLKTSAFSLFKSRIVWLLFLMVSATFSSAILNKFESLLPAVLLIFVPMLMGTGGNGGGQSSVTIIRAISLGEVEFSNLARIIWKEVRVGAFCGVTLGAVAFLKVLFIDRWVMQNPAVTTSVALAVAISIAVTIIVSKLVGSMLPLIAKKLGFDPSVMASPFITTLVDVLALLLYFAVSYLLLPI